MNQQQDFGEMPVISVYTDEQAVEDGVLVAFPGDGRVNRVTRAVFEHFADKSMAPIIVNITPIQDAIRFMLEQPQEDGWRTTEDYKGKRLWLLPNEVNGFTLMFPEDY